MFNGYAKNSVLLAIIDKMCLKSGFRVPESQLPSPGLNPEEIWG